MEAYTWILYNALEWYCRVEVLRKRFLPPISSSGARMEKWCLSLCCGYRKGSWGTIEPSLGSVVSQLHSQERQKPWYGPHFLGRGCEFAELESKTVAVPAYLYLCGLGFGQKIKASEERRKETVSDVCCVCTCPDSLFRKHNCPINNVWSGKRIWMWRIL